MLFSRFPVMQLANAFAPSLFSTKRVPVTSAGQEFSQIFFWNLIAPSSYSSTPFALLFLWLLHDMMRLTPRLLGMPRDVACIQMKATSSKIKWETFYFSYWSSNQDGSICIMGYLSVHLYYSVCEVRSNETTLIHSSVHGRKIRKTRIPRRSWQIVHGLHLLGAQRSKTRACLYLKLYLRNTTSHLNPQRPTRTVQRSWLLHMHSFTYKRRLSSLPPQHRTDLKQTKQFQKQFFSEKTVWGWLHVGRCGFIKRRLNCQKRRRTPKARDSES